MSWFSKLFGGEDGKGPSPANVDEHQGFRIIPEPIKEGTVFRLAARIEKDVGGETKVHHLIRADTLESRQAAVAAATAKARQVIDEQGERLFD